MNETFHFHLVFYARYKILAPQEADKAGDDMKAVAQAILDAVNLDAESYRLGHTKACSGPHPARVCPSPLYIAFLHLKEAVWYFE